MINRNKKIKNLLKEINILYIIIIMSLTFTEIKELILSSDPNDRAEIISKYLKNLIILTGLSNSDFMYEYDEKTVTFKKGTKLNDIIIIMASKLISVSVKKLTKRI